MAKIYATDKDTGLTADFLRTILEYDRSTGIFYWRHRDDRPEYWNKRYAGKPAGFVNNRGYLAIRINGRNYQAHRLAWLYCFSEWPVDQLDHINGIKSDNRIDNLRDVTGHQNHFNRGIAKNNTSGTPGVRFDEQKKKWRSYIMINYQLTHLGYFHSEQEAIAARRAAEIEHFGKHSRTSSRTN